MSEAAQRSYSRQRQRLIAESVEALRRRAEGAPLEVTYAVTAFRVRAVADARDGAVVEFAGRFQVVAAWIDGFVAGQRWT